MVLIRHGIVISILAGLFVFNHKKIAFMASVAHNKKV
jgi:hypothetical protein